MSTTEPARVSVRILEKEYFVACPHEERAALLDAAEFLNGRMREIRDSGKVVGLDRIAVMAALNLANELLRHSRAGSRRSRHPRSPGCGGPRTRRSGAGHATAAGTVAFCHSELAPPPSW